MTSNLYIAFSLSNQLKIPCDAALYRRQPHPYILIGYIRAPLVVGAAKPILPIPIPAHPLIHKLTQIRLPEHTL